MCVQLGQKCRPRALNCGPDTRPAGPYRGGRTDRRRTAVRRAGRTATMNVRGVPDNAAAGLLLLLLIVNCHRHITVTEHRSRTGDDHCHEAAARTSPVCHSCRCSPSSARHSDLPLPYPAACHSGPVSSRRFCPERTITMNYNQLFNYRRETARCTILTFDVIVITGCDVDYIFECSKGIFLL